MAKDRRKLQHIHSSIPDRQPTPSTLEVGEIAVNNAANQEFLSIKNSDDKVVRFSSDEQIMTWTEKKEVMPYKGYVRGETGPSSTSGETPTSDIYGSYGITDNDLLTNKSNIVIKLNQVAADNTIKHNRVNGAKDAYDKYVNPTEDGGITDGAGFYIDMSRYAMQGANPTFSGITNTCYSVLNGRTEILGGDGTEGDCRSLLNIDVLSATTNISSAWTTVGTADTTINSAKTDVETALTEVTSANTTIGTDILHVSGTTTEIHDGDVLITNNSDKTENTGGDILINTTGTTTINNYSKRNINVSGGTELNSCDSVLINTNDYKVQQCDGEQGSAEFNFCDSFKVNSDNVEIKQCSSAGTITIVEKEANYSGETLSTYTSGNTVVNADGNVGITAKGDIIATSSESNIYITANDNICETAGINAAFYGVSKTNVGLNCDDDTKSTTTNVYGDTINVSANTANTTIISAATNITSATTVIGTADTNINSATTIIETANTTINVANTTATTHNYEGDTLTSDINYVNHSGYSLSITEGMDINITSPSIVVSGNSLNITEDTTDITSCEHLYMKSDDIKLEECENDGSVLIKSTDTEISGTTLIVNEGDDVTFNIGDDLVVNTSGDTFMASTGNTCITSQADADFYGKDNTKIGVSCNDNVTTDVTIKSSGTTNIYGPTINISGSSVNVTGDTYIDGDLTVSGTVCASSGLCKTLSWTYGSVCNEGSGNTNFKDDKSFVIPKTISDVTCGDVVDNNPGTASGCLNINKNVCVTGKIEVSNGVFNTSDERLKDSIERADFAQMLAARNVEIKSFVYKNDESKRTTYGVIAQEVKERNLNEIVYENEEGMLSVDYTSLMILKIAYLENEVTRLTHQLSKLLEKLGER